MQKEEQREFENRKRKLAQKQNNYAAFVKEMHRPVASKEKALELKILIENSITQPRKPGERPKRPPRNLSNSSAENEPEEGRQQLTGSTLNIINPYSNLPGRLVSRHSNSGLHSAKSG